MVLQVEPQTECFISRYTTVWKSEYLTLPSFASVYLSKVQLLYKHISTTVAQQHKRLILKSVQHLYS